MAEPHGQLMRYKKRRRRPSLFLRLRARDGEFRAPARVTFFFCKKKVTKENRLKLRFKTSLARGGFRRCGGELAFPWRGGGLRRPHFFLRRKKCGKESRLDLRSKGPLARGGQVRIWRCWLRGIGAAGEVVGSGDRLYLLRRCRWCGARVGAGARVIFGDYQIAPLAPCGGKGRCARWAQDIIIS